MPCTGGGGRRVRTGSLNRWGQIWAGVQGGQCLDPILGVGGVGGRGSCMVRPIPVNR